MAIEYKLTGDLDLSDDLQRGLLSVLGVGAITRQPEPAHIAFELVAPTLSVSGVHLDAGAMLFFRVLDKNQVVAATTLAVACVGAVLASTTDDVTFWRDETRLLERSAGRVRIFRRDPGAAHPFWSPERLELLGLGA